MKKVLICGVLAASFGFSAAYAGTAPQNFDVKASVSARCIANNGATNPVIDFGPVLSLDATAVIPSPTANIAFKCTRGLPIVSAALSTTASTVAGMAYSLTLGAVAATPGAAAAGGVGAGADAYSYPVKGTMAAGQAGDTAAPTTDTQTLTITF